MDIWKGTIVPLRKHRDYLHDTFLEHARDAGLVVGFRTKDGDYVEVIDYDEDAEEEVLEDIRHEAEKLLEYWFAKSPITGLELDNPELYYALVITMSGSDYDYYIPAPGGQRMVPNPALISAILDEYMANQEVDRSDISDFLIDQYN